MRKAIQVLILLAIFAVAALGQSPAQCRITKRFLTLGGQPDRFATVTIFSIKVGGTGNPGYTTGRLVLKTDSNGDLLGVDNVTVGWDAPQGAIIQAYSGANTQLPNLGANPNTGTQYQVPNKNAANLDELIWNLASIKQKGALLIGGANGIASQFTPCPDGQTIIWEAAQTLGARCGVPGAVLSVFGRTGAVVAQSGDYTFAQIGSKPTTLVGYGIVDAAPLSHTHTASQISDSTTAGRTLLTAVDATAQRTALGLAPIAATGSASDLSAGTVPDARFPVTLPGVSGANLTALNASNLASGTVPAARLGSGTANSTTYLRGDNTWQTVTGGATINSTDGAIPYRLNSGAFADSPFSRVDANTGALAGSLVRSNGQAAYNLASFQDGGGTGAIAITTNILLASNTFFAIDLLGYLYDADAPQRLTVSGYAANLGSPQFYNYGFSATGSKRWTVRLARETSTDKLIVILGSTADTQPINRWLVASVLLNSTGQVSGWSIARISSTATYDTLTTVPETSTARAVRLPNAYLGLQIDNASGVAQSLVNISGGNMVNFTGGSYTTVFGGNPILFAVNNVSTHGMSATGLGVGVTSPTAALDVRPSSTSTIGQIIRLASGQTANALNIENSVGTGLSAFKADGSLGVGTASPATMLEVKHANGGTGLRIVDATGSSTDFSRNSSTGNLDITGAANVNGIRVALNGSATQRLLLDLSGNLTISGTITIGSGGYTTLTNTLLNGLNTAFYSNAQGTAAYDGGLQFRNGSLGAKSAIQPNAGKMEFYTNSANTNFDSSMLRLTIDTAGNVGIGATSFGASAAKVLALADGTAPSTSPANIVQIYSETGEAKVRDSAGNVTTFSPHNFRAIPNGPSEPMAWAYHSERDGIEISVDMLRAIRLLEHLSGEKLAFLRDKATGQPITPDEYLKRFKN